MATLFMEVDMNEVSLLDMQLAETIDAIITIGIVGALSLSLALTIWFFKRKRQ